jgi:hypothetical protein
MKTNTCGWIFNVIGIAWVVFGKPEIGMTCFCTAVILFSLKDSD